MSIIVNEHIKISTSKDILIYYSEFFEKLFSKKFKESQKKELINIYIDTVKSIDDWKNIENIILLFHNNELIINNLNSCLTDPKNIESIIYTLQYLQCGSISYKYIQLLTDYIINNYDISSDIGLLLIKFLEIIEFSDNINNDLEKIFISSSINQNYLKIKDTIINSSIDLKKKSILLLNWSYNFEDYEYIVKTDYQYINLNLLKSSDNLLPDCDMFWNNVLINTPTWQEFLKNELPEYAIISGGFIPTCMLNNRMKNYSDIDIWILDYDEQKLDNLLSLIDNYLKRKNIIEQYYLIKKSILSIHIKNEPPLQIIFTNYNSPHDIITNFDFDYLYSFIQGENIYLSTRSLYCYLTRTTRYTNRFPKNTISVERHMKTIEKNFEISEDRFGTVPNLSIKNLLTENILDSHPLWLETKNKYVLFENNVYRNNLLIKSIYNGIEVENDITNVLGKHDFDIFKLNDYMNSGFQLSTNKINPTIKYNLYFENTQTPEYILVIDFSIIPSNHFNSQFINYSTQNIFKINSYGNVYSKINFEQKNILKILNINIKNYLNSLLSRVTRINKFNHWNDYTINKIIDIREEQLMDLYEPQIYDHEIKQFISTNNEQELKKHLQNKYFKFTIQIDSIKVRIYKEKIYESLITLKCTNLELFSDKNKQNYENFLEISKINC